MTKLEYLQYVFDKKGMIYYNDSESRLSEIKYDDFNELVRQGYLQVDVDEANQPEAILLTSFGRKYLDNIE